ncbi:type II secretion system protein [Acinetobacter defluvii]|uniref:Type II secretion system protein n=1 Tax=Acinetobacter defluvii TaxID=1871111 RepID=A0A2S2FEB4_9GAMM|nr:type II secretion system protein [Acinetobacter defluvii]AWL29145.1 type II secretion system protein [Acinetobacter defluvii]
MNTPSSVTLQKGFTLIELMVVIVIISIMASLIVLNIDGVDHRKALQAREFLLLDLKKINRDANDQAHVYALDILPATDVAPFRYKLVQYQPYTESADKSLRVIEQKPWKDVPNFDFRSLPERISFTVQSQEHRYQNANNADLLGNNAPKMIWFGNGEAKPVKIQMYYDQKPIGDLIDLDYLGKVTDEE